MPDYKTMYYKLFNAVTDAVEILQQAQIEAEERYIKSSEKDEHKIVNLKIIEENKKNDYPGDE